MRVNRFLLILLVSFLETANSQTPTLLPPSELVAGASQEEWSKRWWRWAMSFDPADSPVADRTGALCANGQAGPVWFLAGTYGTRRTERTCRIQGARRCSFRSSTT